MATAHKDVLGKLEGKATRYGYSDGLLILGKTDPRVFVLDADLAKSTTSERFKKEFPDRFIDCGIAEADMVGIAAGLSLMGKVPFTSTYGTFMVDRALDQIRVTVAYAELNVKIVGAHGGISVGPDGATHQALEDLGIMRMLPHMIVMNPCDVNEARKATLAVAAVQGPAFIRLGREAVPILTDDATPFEIGMGITLEDGDDVTIAATGYMVYEALLAHKELKKQGIHARVLNIHTIKPIDRELLLKAARETGAVVTAEEHQVMGGFGSAVAEVLVQDCPV
ncbi:MAG TPA: transketolase C-terminal domain-containing protein, partial [Candidatus Cryosericum sp.]